MKHFLVLLRKELLLESKGRETCTLLICNTLILSVLVCAGVNSAILEQRTVARIYPMLLWVVFLCVIASSLMRSYEVELEERGFEGLILAGADSSVIFLAKAVILAGLLDITFLLSALVLSLGLNIDLWSGLWHLVLLSTLVSIGVSSLGVIVSAIAGSARLPGIILPILLLPLLVPFYLAGIELTNNIVSNGGYLISSVWVSIVVAADIVFFLVGLNLYEYLLRE